MVELIVVKVVLVVETTVVLVEAWMVVVVDTETVLVTVGAVATRAQAELITSAGYGVRFFGVESARAAISVEAGAEVAKDGSRMSGVTGADELLWSCLRRKFKVEVVAAVATTVVVTVWVYAVVELTTTIGGVEVTVTEAVTVGMVKPSRVEQNDCRVAKVIS